MPWDYSAFGLRVECAVPLPELSAAGHKARESAPDVEIIDGDLAGMEPTKPCAEARYFGACARGFFIDIPEVARFEISCGAKIIFWRSPAALDETIRLYLLGSAFGALLMQRGCLVLHANAVIPKGHRAAIMCVGPSGSGKSTTAVALAQRGAAILTDDVCVIDKQGRALPGIARAKLCEDAAHALAINVSGLPHVARNIPKLSIPLASRGALAPAPPRAAFVLEPSDGARITATELTAIERFTALRSNLYRPEFLGPLGVEEALFEPLAELSRTLRIFRVTRPREGFDIEGLMKCLLATLAELEHEVTTT
ncbi:MAG: hypothetical protein AAF841_04525 [Pseudomonadota bacterium]